MTGRADGQQDANELAATVLLERIQARDREALELLLERIQPKIQRWIRKERGQLIRSKWDTLDLSQDVALELFLYLPRIGRANSKVLESILYRMIQNTLRDKHDQLMALRRRVTREQPLAGESPLDLDRPVEQVETPSEVAERREEKAWVRLALPLLQAEDEELIIRVKMNQESYVEIGEQEGSSPDAVRMRCNRAMARLTRLVGLLRRGQAGEALEIGGGTTSA